MFWLKSCPHCAGDLYDARDLFGGYLACLQCGHYLSELEELAVGCMSAAASETGLTKPEAGEYGVFAGLEQSEALEQVV